MKVIDLLNKIANGEEVPKYIKYRNWNNNSFDKMLVCKENIFYKLDQLEIYLNDEVEIIEEDKEIEESIKKLGKKLNGCFKLMVESKKYYYPKIHEDLLEKEDKEIEEINIWYEFDGKNNDEIIYHMCTELKDKINELIKAVNELKKGK